MLLFETQSDCFNWPELIWLKIKALCFFISKRLSQLMSHWETIQDRSSQVSPARLVYTRNYPSEHDDGIYEGNLN